MRSMNVLHVSSLAGLGAHVSFVIVHLAFWFKPWQLSQNGRTRPPCFGDEPPRGHPLQSWVWQRELLDCIPGEP